MEPAAPPRPPSSWRDRLDLIASGAPPGPTQVAGAVAGLAALVVVGWLLLREPTPPPEATLPRAAPAATSTTVAPTVIAHAAGAVRRPGIYTLTTGGRVADLLALAGGPTSDADLDRVNLAAKVADGSQIYVPRRGEAAPASAGDGDVALATSGPLDLNVATVDQLDELPGIGPATAKAIIDTRERLGRFRSVEDLLEVRGIGPAKLDALRDLVTVG